MKRLGALTCVAVTLLAVLALTVRLAAQEPQQKAHKTHYTVHDLGTLGGTFSWALGINNKGSVDGYSTLPSDTAAHAFLWRKKKMIDLGTLGGTNSWPAYGPNESDEVTGASNTSSPDPTGEDFCGWGSYQSCIPFLWRDGVMTALPTLGGNNGVAEWPNNRGQIVGTVENTTSDACGWRNFQMRPVLWERGRIRELPILPGDPNGSANGINDLGQIAGGSGCRPFFSGVAILWNRGKAIPLGTLGGPDSGLKSVNNHGQAFGYSVLPDTVTYHAILWEKSRGMLDLGTLSGDTYSDAWAIDEKGQVVGTSCDADFNCRAFLWRDGVMTDLNNLIALDSLWFLIEGDGINSRGEIVGLGLNLSTGEVHAFLANPRHCGSGPECDALAAQSNSLARPTVVLPENVRKLLQHRQGARFGVALTRPQ